MHIIGVGHFCRLAGIEVFNALQKGAQIDISRLGANIGARAGLDHRHQHALVQSGYHGLPSSIFFVACLTAIAVKFRNGATSLTGHTGSVDFDSRCSGFICPGQGVVFVVLSVGEDHDHLAGLTLRIK